MWKDTSNPEVAHLHAVRASFGHIYSWIRVERLGMSVPLTQLHTLCDLHMIIRPLFLDTIVLSGIVTRQHRGNERMSTCFCTHIVLSSSKVDSVDRRSPGAELTDYIVFLDKSRMMLDGITFYRVDEVIFVATGPISPACIKGVYKSYPGGFKSVYISNPKSGQAVKARHLLVEEVSYPNVPVGATHPQAPLLNLNVLVGATHQHALLSYVPPASGSQPPTRGSTSDQTIHYVLQ